MNVPKYTNICSEYKIITLLSVTWMDKRQTTSISYISVGIFGDGLRFHVVVNLLGPASTQRYYFYLFGPILFSSMFTKYLVITL